MVYGYGRVSRPKQKVERQVENILRAYPDAKIITEAYSGRILDRPQWSKLHKALRKGDTVVFDEVSRMSRNAEDGFALYEQLYRDGVELCFLKEPHINTAVYRTALENTIQMTGTAVDCILEGINQYLMRLAKEQIRLAFETAEHEVEFLRERTREGIQKAHDNGHMSGHQSGTTFETKKAKASKEIIKRHSVTFGGSLADPEVITLCGCTRNTYYKYKKELLKEFQ